MSDAIPTVRISQVSKSFNGVTVLDRVSLDIRPGEVHGLIGENGSGKSTLVKVLGGVYEPDAGSICEINGESIQLPIQQPQHHGIAIIHQDLALNDDMTVAENVGISIGFGSRPLGRYRSRREIQIVRELSDEFQLNIDPAVRVATLTQAERSVVAILRALRSLQWHRSKRQVLILDEPTAALPASESERLLKIVRGLAAAGTAVIFIGHRLHEVLDVCDRVSVLRSGRLVDTVDASTTTDSRLVEMMLGYDIGAFYPERHAPRSGSNRLAVSGLSGGTVQDLSLQVAPGEILGVTGLTGMGQDEVPYLLNGRVPPIAGRVVVDETTVRPGIQGALAAGIALVPADRLRDSIWTGGTAAENLTLPFLPLVSRRGLLRLKDERRVSLEEMERFGVRPLAPTHPLGSFSGGNQQKIVLARWLYTNPSVLLLHEPTQGVDAGAKKEIFGLIQQAADRGAAIVVFSSDIEEVAHMCHRVLVMRHGRVSTELQQSELSEDRLIAASQHALENPSRSEVKQ